MSDCIHGKPLFENCFECFPPDEFPAEKKGLDIIDLKALESDWKIFIEGKLRERITELEAERDALREAAKRVVDKAPSSGPLWVGGEHIGRLIALLQPAPPTEEGGE